MINTRRLLPLVAGLFFVNAAAADAKPIELQYQSIYAPAQTQTVEILKPWAESFAQKSNGDLIVHHFPVNAVVESTEMPHALQNGLLDISEHTGTGFPRETPHLYMMNMPFLIKNSRHGTAIAYKLYEEIPAFRKEVELYGNLLTFWSSASYALTSVKVPVRAPSDIKGRRVLIGVPSDAAVIETWGGVPVFVPPSDMYVGLQRGMGEMLYLPIPYQKGLRIMEVTRYITLLPATFMPVIMEINPDTLAALSDSQKKLLLDNTGRQLGETLAASLDKDVQDVMKLFADAGAETITLNDAQLDAFRDSMKSLVEGFWMKNLRDYGIKGDIKALIDQYYAIAASVPAPQ